MNQHLRTSATAAGVELPHYWSVCVGAGRANEGLRISDLKPGAVFMIETLERNHGCALDAWTAIGAPEPPTRRQTRILRESAMALRKEFVTAGADGMLAVDITLAPWSIVCITEVSLKKGE